VLALDAGTSQMNSYCTPKGRMLANFRVFMRGESYYLRLPRTMVEPVLKRLRMFVLRARVTLRTPTTPWCAWVCPDPTPVDELVAALGSAPTPRTP
jgi:tRNA-modifying protein YgfZ